MGRAVRDPAISPELEAWAARGDYFRTALGGHRVYFQRRRDASAGSGETLLVLHGFPESSYSFHKVADGLARRFGQVVLFDMPGFGLSDKPERGYGYSLLERADAALQLWRHLGVRGGHVLAHDMGDSVATELAARQVNGTLPTGFEGFRSKEQVCKAAVLTTMPGVGHFCQLSNPETWLECTGAFFDQTRRMN